MSTSNENQKVLIIDDHPVFRCGLRQIVDGDAAFTVVGEAGDGKMALSMFEDLKPDLVIVDVCIPKIGGLELVRLFRDSPHPAACLVLTMSADESTFTAAIDAGASGFILKDNAVDLVLMGLKVVASGGLYICPAATNFLLKRQERASALKQEKTGLAAITPTERRILRLLSENRTNKEIAEDLFLSPRTIEKHRNNLCRKLDLRGPNKLLQFAIEHRSEI